MHNNPFLQAILDLCLPTCLSKQLLFLLSEKPTYNFITILH